MFTILGADGREYGPADIDQVKAWIADGRANLDTKAKRAGEDVWRRLGDFPEFGPAQVPPQSGAPSVAPVVVSGPPHVDPAAIAADLIARAKPLDVFSCLDRGWNLVKTDFWAVVGATTVAVMILVLAGAFPYFGAVFNLLFRGVFIGGLAFFLLKKIRRKPADIGDIFAGFTIAFAALVLASLVSAVLTAVGFILLVIPGIYLAVAYAFTFVLAIDKNLDFWPAMEVSRRVITAQWWRVFLLMVLSVILGILGLLGLIVGVFITSAIATAALIFAYEDLCNPPPKAPDAGPTAQ